MKSIRDVQSWAVHNDGSQRFIDIVLNYINKHSSNKLHGDRIGKYYGLTNHRSARVMYTSSINKAYFTTILTIDQFEKLAYGTFTVGEKIEVYTRSGWANRIYLGYIQGAKKPYICVDGNHTGRYVKGEPFETSNWSTARKILTDNIKVKVTINGQPAKLSDLTEEQLLELREECAD